MAMRESWLQQWLDSQREQPDATRVKPTFEQSVRQLPQRGIKARGASGLPMPKEPSTARKVAGTAAGFLPGSGAWEGGKLMKEGHPLMALAMLGTEFIPGFGSLGKKGVKRFAILTAENAGGVAMAAEKNSGRMASLLKELKARGYEPVPVKGRYQDPTTGAVLEESSFLIPNMGEREAKLIGQRFGQNGVITQGGYHDMVAGKTFKATGIKPTTDVPYTELPNGKRFALDIDWDKPAESAVKALPVPKGGNAEVLRLAEELRSGVLGRRELAPVKAVDPEKGKLMAQQYERLQSMPDSPEVRRAYDQLAFETKQQLRAIEDAGYKVEYVDSDPYKSSAEMMKDIRDNRTIKVLKTTDESAHPILSKEQNDQFRAVHDFFGHAQRGYQFGPKGEEGAFRSHSSMFSPEAARAMATETRGQNSFVNFGPNADKPAAERGFAPQKAALWPRELLGEYADMILPPDVPVGKDIAGMADEAEAMVAKNNTLLERSQELLGQRGGAVADSAVAGGVRFAAAIRTPDGKVYTGFSHWPAIEAAIAGGSLPNAEAEGFERALKKSKEGFIRESDNKFLTRNQASRSPEARGIPRRVTGNGQLGSEDLGPAGRRFTPDSAAVRAVEGLPLLDAGGKARLVSEKPISGLYTSGSRYLFQMPNGTKVEILGKKVGDDFRVNWVGVPGRDGFSQDVGTAGAAGMRQLGRQIKELTGAKTISGERISGARPIGDSPAAIYSGEGREAKRVISDSLALTPRRALAKNAQGLGRNRSAAIISGDPSTKWGSLFDYKALGKDLVPVEQTPLPRAKLVQPSAVAKHEKMQEKATERLRSPEVMDLLDKGLTERGDLFYYQDQLARTMMDLLGEKEGLERFTLWNKTVAATSAASDMRSNIRRAGALFPHVLQGTSFNRIRDLNAKLAPGLGNIAANNAQKPALARVAKGSPWLSADPDDLVKMDSFWQNLGGNFNPGTIDRHANSLTGLPKSAYAPAEGAFKTVADELAASGKLEVPAGRAATAPFQAGVWIGDALEGRVKSPPVPALSVLEAGLRETANLEGINVNEALRRFIRGQLWGFAGGAPGLTRF